MAVSLVLLLWPSLRLIALCLAVPLSYPLSPPPPAPGYLHHQLVHYSHTFNRGSFPKRLSSTPDGRVLFNPRGVDIQVGLGTCWGALRTLCAHGPCMYRLRCLLAAVPPWQLAVQVKQALAAHLRW